LERQNLKEVSAEENFFQIFFLCFLQQNLSNLIICWRKRRKKEDLKNLMKILHWAGALLYFTSVFLFIAQNEKKKGDFVQKNLTIIEMK